MSLFRRAGLMAAAFFLSCGVAVANGPTAAAFVEDEIATATKLLIPASVSLMEVSAGSTMWAPAAGGASAAAGGVCATGVGCVVLAAGAALGVGAWWAYNNWDTVASWFGADGGSLYPGDHVGPGQDPSRFARIDPSDFLVTYESGVPSAPLQWYVEATCKLPSGSLSSWSAASSGYFYASNGYQNDRIRSWNDSSCAPLGGSIVYARAALFNESFWYDMGMYGDPGAYRPTKADVVCVRSDGSTFSLTGTGSGTYSEPSVTVPSCAASEPGARTQSLTLSQQDPAGTYQPAVHWESNDAALASYPDCLPGGADFPCALQLTHNGDPCTEGSAACAYWWARAQTNPVPYECRWGGYTMPLSDCGPLRYAFQTGAPVIDEPLPEAPAPGISPDYGDPTTYPEYPGPIAPPGTGDAPGPATSDAGAGDAGCGIGWSQILDGTIVYKAVSCALAWAFVPPDGTFQEAVETASGGFDGSNVGQSVAGLGGIFTGLFGMWGNIEPNCHGPEYHIPIPGQPPEKYPVIRPLDACDPPMSQVATTVKILTAMMVSVSGVLFVAYPFLKSLGLPPLRAVPASSSGD